jgi:hypothetical protein
MGYLLKLKHALRTLKCVYFSFKKLAQMPNVALMETKRSTVLNDFRFESSFSICNYKCLKFSVFLNSLTSMPFLQEELSFKNNEIKHLVKQPIPRIPEMITVLEGS